MKATLRYRLSVYSICFLVTVAVSCLEDTRGKRGGLTVKLGHRIRFTLSFLPLHPRLPTVLELATVASISSIKNALARSRPHSLSLQGFLPLLSNSGSNFPLPLEANAMGDRTKGTDGDPEISQHAGGRRHVPRTYKGESLSIDSKPLDSSSYPLCTNRTPPNELH